MGADDHERLGTNFGEGAHDGRVALVVVLLNVVVDRDRVRESEADYELEVHPVGIGHQVLILLFERLGVVEGANRPRGRRLELHRSFGVPEMGTEDTYRAETEGPALVRGRDVVNRGHRLSCEYVMLVRQGG